MKPFNLDDAKQGKPVCTKDGHSVRIICFDAKNVYPIVALIFRHSDVFSYEDLFMYDTAGIPSHYYTTDERDILMMV